MISVYASGTFFISKVELKNTVKINFALIKFTCIEQNNFL